MGQSLCRGWPFGPPIQTRAQRPELFRIAASQRLEPIRERRRLTLVIQLLRKLVNSHHSSFLSYFIRSDRYRPGFIPGYTRGRAASKNVHQQCPFASEGTRFRDSGHRAGSPRSAGMETGHFWRDSGHSPRERTYTTREGAYITRERASITREGVSIRRERASITREGSSIHRGGASITRERVSIRREGAYKLPGECPAPARGHP